MSTFHDQIIQIVKDKVHGSNYLLNRLLSIFKNHKNSVRTKDLDWAFDQLGSMDPALAIIHHFVASLGSNTVPGFYKQLDTYMADWSNIEHVLANKLKETVDLENKTILTHSNSGTVQKVLHELFQVDKPFSIIQTKSLPGGEGVIQAESLKKAGLTVELIEDRKVKQTMSQIDLVVFGCDQYSQQALVNKVGTQAIITEAINDEIPVVILADSRKCVKKIKSIGVLFEKLPMTDSISLITERKE